MLCGIRNSDDSYPSSPALSGELVRGPRVLLIQLELFPTRARYYFPLLMLSGQGCTGHEGQSQRADLESLYAHLWTPAVQGHSRSSSEARPTFPISAHRQFGWTSSIFLAAMADLLPRRLTINPLRVLKGVFFSCKPIVRPIGPPGLCLRPDGRSLSGPDHHCQMLAKAVKEPQIFFWRDHVIPHLAARSEAGKVPECLVVFTMMAQLDSVI